jgi:hypothetical protein
MQNIMRAHVPKTGENILHLSSTFTLALPICRCHLCANHLSNAEHFQGILAGLLVCQHLRLIKFYRMWGFTWIHHMLQSLYIPDTSVLFQPLNHLHSLPWLTAKAWRFRWDFMATFPSSFGGVP